jgi:hypothetical protein
MRQEPRVSEDNHIDADPMAIVRDVLSQHYIECTGAGEVTCRCREGGWMSPDSHRRHQANALHAAGVLRPVESSRSTAERTVLDAADEWCTNVVVAAGSAYSQRLASAVRALRAVVSPGDGQQ